MRSLSYGLVIGIQDGVHNLLVGEARGFGSWEFRHVGVICKTLAIRLERRKGMASLGKHLNHYAPTVACSDFRLLASFMGDGVSCKG